MSAENFRPLPNGELIQKSEARKDHISNEEMGNLLSAVGNHEAKALAIIIMDEECVYTSNSLFQQIMGAQDLSPGWDFAKETSFAWLRHSFKPIGLVAEEMTDHWQNSYGYYKTKKGTELGVPLAGLLTEFSSSHEHSLYQYFGSTFSQSAFTEDQQSDLNVEDRKKRSPYVRLEILKCISLTNSLLDVETISQTIGENSQLIYRHLLEMTKNGILQYGPPQPGSYNRRTIQLKDTQQQDITDLINLIENFQKLDPDTIAAGSRFAQDLKHDPDKIRSLMEKSKNQSPYANMFSAKATFQQIKVYLEEYGIGLTTKAIQQILEDHYGRKLNIKSLNKYLKKFESMGLLTKTIFELNAYWELKEDGTSISNL